MKYPRRSQYKYAKSPYRIRNWSEYEAGLRRRGDLSVWLSDKAINSWRARPSGKPGGQRIYANIAIEAALTIRVVFRLPLRQIDNRVTSVSADGAYDTEGTYEAAHALGQGRHVRVVISPRRDAQLSPRPSAALRERSRTRSTGTRQSSVDVSAAAPW